MTQLTTKTIFYAAIGSELMKRFADYIFTRASRIRFLFVTAVTWNWFLIDPFFVDNVVYYLNDVLELERNR